VPDGADGFLTFFEPFLERNPVREIELVCLYEDGPWVFCSAYQSLNGGAARWVTMDLFHTDADGLILEHWDTIAAYETETVSGEDMVGGQRNTDPSADGSVNKATVLEYVKQVLQEGCHEKLGQFVSEDVIQHSPMIAGGRSGLEAWLKSAAAGRYEMLFHLMGEGDIVVTYGKRHAAGQDIAVFDIYRLANGLIVEHWSNTEEILPREDWGNSGKF
ncbi:MAG: nuclear transport factor 2 family protein, partial [Pseudomonadota bacterium]